MRMMIVARPAIRTSTSPAPACFAARIARTRSACVTFAHATGHVSNQPRPRPGPPWSHQSDGMSQGVRAMESAQIVQAVSDRPQRGNAVAGPAARGGGFGKASAKFGMYCGKCGNCGNSWRG